MPPSPSTKSMTVCPMFGRTVQAYSDIWVGLGLLAKIKPDHHELQQATPAAIKLISADLIKIFNGNRRWQATELDQSDVAIIASSIESCSIANEKFIGDLGDIIRHTIKQASELDLVLLTKGAYYMRSFKHSKDIYSVVHAEATS